MKIVLLTAWYSERMGYIENCLPKSLAKMGHEVHLISSTAQVYYNSPDYEKVYEPFLGKNILAEGVRQVDGYNLHRIPFRSINGKVCFKKLRRTLKKIKPEVVQVFDPSSYTTLQAAYHKLFLGYKLFTANHTVASVFPLYRQGKNSFGHRIAFFFLRTVPGRMISWLTSRSFPATIDALDLAVKYYGIQKHKVKLASLGVDTDLFCPAKSTDQRSAGRKELGFKEGDIVCIYTGRFTEGKDPLLLARAIHDLAEAGEPFKAVFMGDGPQLEEIKKKNGCVVHKFVPYHELPGYYALADIGCWPRQESTSMIDAASCGLPILISDKVQAKERVEGNGLTYAENDVDDLRLVLMELKDQDLRAKLGRAGTEKIRDRFSWDMIAKERMRDYEFFVRS